MRWITELKSWQVLVILYTPGFAGGLLPLAWSARVTLILIPTLLVYGWMWSAASALAARIPGLDRPRSGLFRFAVIYASMYWIVFMVAMMTTSIHEDTFVIVAPFHVVAMFTSLYMYWFVAKVTTLVRGDDQAWSRFLTFVVMSPVAIWRTQKVVSQLAE